MYAMTLDCSSRSTQQIPVLCANVGSEVAKSHTMLLPQSATVATLMTALQSVEGTKKAVHVFVNGAVPSKDVTLCDLCVDGSVCVTYSVEGKYGAGVVNSSFCASAVSSS